MFVYKQTMRISLIGEERNFKTCFLRTLRVIFKRCAWLANSFLLSDSAEI